MKILSLITIFITSFLFAQKIQIKKDKIFFNEKESAIISSPYRDHYEIFDLNNVKSFEVDLKGISFSREDALYYLEVKSSDGKTVQIPYRSKENFLDKYAQIRANRIADQQQINSKLNNIKSIYNPRIGSGWEVLFNNGNYPEKIVGYIKVNQCSGFSSVPCVEVWDLDNIKVAEMYSTQEVRKYIVKTYDNNQFTYFSSRSYALSDYVFFSEFLSYLILEGYILEHQAYYNDLSP